MDVLAKHTQMADIGPYADVDGRILAVMRESPGCKQAEVVKRVFPHWSGFHVRTRIKALEARGVLRVERISPSHFRVYPGERFPR